MKAVCAEKTYKFTGLTSPTQTPDNPEMASHSDRLTVAESAHRIFPDSNRRHLH
jgi:hypothetical protein